MNNNNKIFEPLITYINAKKEKARIYKDNNNKSGIYCWNNIITNKSYVGSSKCLSARFSNYYSTSYLKRKINKGPSGIYNSILKHGLDNFNLYILEYCESNILIKREQYYMDKLKPKYNILKIAGSTLGFKHSLKSKLLMSISTRGDKHPMFGKTPSIETRIKIGEKHRTSLKIKLIPNIIKPKSEKKLFLETIARRGINIKIFDIKGNLVNEFPTINSAAKYFEVSDKTISRILNKDIIHEGFIYKFEAVDNRIWIYNYKNKLIKILSSIKEVQFLYNIPPSTLRRYIKSSKLYKDEFYFYDINSKYNPYFNNK